jgi:hypothetical protein
VAPEIKVLFVEAMELLVQQRCVSSFYNDLQDARDCQMQRKSYKTTRIVGWKIRSLALRRVARKSISRCYSLYR